MRVNFVGENDAMISGLALRSSNPNDSDSNLTSMKFCAMVTHKKDASFKNGLIRHEFF